MAMRIVVRIIATLVIGMMGVGASVLTAVCARRPLGPWWTYTPVFALWAIIAQFMSWTSVVKRIRQK